MYQLRLYTGKLELAMDFTEATFSFTDGTAEEIGKQVQWGSGADTGTLYADRQKAREDIGAEYVPQIFTRLQSGDRKRSAFFLAELKTADKGWIEVRFDALDLEEVFVGRRTDWGGARLLDTWAHFPAGGRSSIEVFREPLAREEFLTPSHVIEATVTAGAELQATAHVTVEPRAAGDRALLFNLDANLRVTSVKSEAGASLPFFQPREPKDRNQSFGEYVAVVLPQPTEAGKPLKLEFTYAGKRVVRNMGGGNYFCQSFGWYPTKGINFAARQKFELKFKYPKRFILVATGNPSGETIEGDWKYATFTSDTPMIVAGFAYGDYKTFSVKANNVSVNVFANKQPDDSLRSVEIFASGALPVEGGTSAPGLALGSLSPANLVEPMGNEVANSIRVFENYFGPFPYKQIAVTNIPFSYGQGWPGLLYLSVISFMDSTQRQQLGIRDHALLTDFFRGHEASHQWWGHLIAWKSYRDQWLSEGFAEFSGYLYLQYRRNSMTEYLSRVRRAKEMITSGDEKSRRYDHLGPLWLGRRLSSGDSPRAYDVLVYYKGGLVLHMLRSLLSNPRASDPDERFKAMMRDFCKQYAYAAASTEDFQKVVEKYMVGPMDLDGNRKLDWFFNQYVYGVGLPQYTFTYQLQDTPDGKTRFIGTVTQSNVPEGWKDVIPLYMVKDGRTQRLALLSIRNRTESFDLVLPVKPEKLLLNANEDILADIKQ